MIKDILLLCSLLFILQGVKAGQFYVHSHLGVLKYVTANMNGNMLHRYFIHKNFSGLLIIVATMYWRKTFI